MVILDKIRADRQIYTHAELVLYPFHTTFDLLKIYNTWDTIPYTFCNYTFW